MSTTRDELEAEAMAEYRAMMRSFKDSIQSVWMEIDLTLPQFRTLMVLAHDGPLVIGQIAQCMNVGLSTGGHLVDKLVQAGLAEREEDSGDRRRTLARLSPKGEELLARLMSGMQLLQARVHELDDDDLNAFLQGIRAINRITLSESTAPH